MKTIETILDEIIEHPPLHGKWLNTLSFLEHVGTRKIHKTQSHPAMTDLVLRHASEEARHAHFFKRMSDRVAPDACPTYEFRYMLAGYPAYRFFQSLDSMVEKSLESEGAREETEDKPYPFAFLCYLYVTTLIEERAGWLYPIYEERLKGKTSDISLGTVISEEERHLSDMYGALEAVDPRWKERMERFRAKESELYDRLFHSLTERTEAELR